MFFVLSKLLLIFILPFTWIVAFFIAALITKKPLRRRRFCIASVTLLAIFSSPFLLNQFAKCWDIKAAPLKNKPYSCVIVLGGFSAEDANGDGYFTLASDRFIQGLKLLSTGKATHILISSGNGNLLASSFREADWAKTQLKLFNVPDSCVIIENRSRNTLENAAFSKILLDKKHLEPPYLLVTSAYHMRRSLGIFKAKNIDVTAYPCNYMWGYKDFMLSDLIPSADPLSAWNIYIKEVVGAMVN